MTPFTRKLLMFAVLYSSVEGLVVNMTFPSKLGFIVKDAALIAAYVLLLAGGQRRQVGSLTRFTVALAVFALVQTLYLLIVSDMPMAARLIGWKMRLIYVPAMLLAYWYVRSFEDYKRFALTLTVVAIPLSLFGIYLYFAGPTLLRSMGGTYSAIVYSTTGVWRVPGTFTSPGQYGLYLTFNAILAMSLLFLGRLSFSLKVVLWTAIGVMVIAMMASGSRTPIILTLACAGLLTISLRRVGRLISMSIVLYAVFAVGFATLGAGVADRVDSIASMEHADRFKRTYFGQLFVAQLMDQPTGHGLGSATVGARHFTEFGEVVLMESYFGVVSYETGLLGLGAFLWVCAAVVAAQWKGRAVMRQSGEFAAPWHAMALFVTMIVLMLPVGTLLDAAPVNLYFWVALGFAAKLYDLERWRLAEELSPPAGATVAPLSVYAPWPVAPPRIP